MVAKPLALALLEPRPRRVTCNTFTAIKLRNATSNFLVDCFLIPRKPLRLSTLQSERIMNDILDAAKGPALDPFLDERFIFRGQSNCHAITLGHSG
ncbi:MAG: hypothetical protein ACREMY_21245 [bacterium]